MWQTSLKGGTACSPLADVKHTLWCSLHAKKGNYGETKEKSKFPSEISNISLFQDTYVFEKFVTKAFNQTRQEPKSENRDFSKPVLQFRRHDFGQDDSRTTLPVTVHFKGCNELKVRHARKERIAKTSTQRRQMSKVNNNPRVNIIPLAWTKNLQRCKDLLIKWKRQVTQEREMERVWNKGPQIFV